MQSFGSARGERGHVKALARCELRAANGVLLAHDSQLFLAPRQRASQRQAFSEAQGLCACARGERGACERERAM